MKLKTKLSIIAFLSMMYSKSFSQIIFPTTGTSTITTCSGTLLDPGGLNNYPINTDGNLVILPSTVGQFVSLTFNSFVTESGYDVLRVFDGTVIGSNLIDAYSGTVGSRYLTASSANGALALRFRSDASTTFSGFNISVGCSATYLGIPTTYYSYLQPSSVSSLAINSNTTWTVSGLPTWLSIKSITGFGNLSNDMTILANNSFSSRSATFTVTGAGATKKIDVFQSGFNNLSLSKNTLLFSTLSGVNTIEVTAVGYPWAITTTIPSWITLSATSGTGINNLSITSTINSGVNRSAELIFTYSNGTKSLKITQLGQSSPNAYMQSQNTSTVTSCGGIIVNPGSLISYNNNENSTITIVPNQVGKNIVLKFINFETESSYDIVRLYDGNSTTTSQIGTGYSGSLSPFTVQSTNTITGAITLNFKSNNLYTYSGFFAEISCPNIIAIPVTGINTITSCDFTVQSNGGIGNYSANSDGVLIIQSADLNKKVQLSFDLFNTESGYDFLYVYDGIGTTTSPILTLTGNSLPNNITSSSGPLTLRFKTDASGTRDGFSAKVECVLPAQLVSVTSLTISGPSVLTVGGSAVNYTASVLPANASTPVKVDWNAFGTSILNTTAITVTPQVAGNYTITAIAYNSVSTITAIKIISIVSPNTGIPVPITSVVISGPDVLTVGGGDIKYTASVFPLNASSPVIVNWTSGSTNIFNTTSVTLTPSSVGLATITAVAFNSVSTVTSFKIVTYVAKPVTNLSSSIIDFKEVLIYPNPATNEATIVTSSTVSLVLVYSLQGQLMLSSTSSTFNISNLSSGIYIVKIITDNGTIINKKLTKE